MLRYTAKPNGDSWHMRAHGGLLIAQRTCTICFVSPLSLTSYVQYCGAEMQRYFSKDWHSQSLLRTVTLGLRIPRPLYLLVRLFPLYRSYDGPTAMSPSLHCISLKWFVYIRHQVDFVLEAALTLSFKRAICSSLGFCYISDEPGSKSFNNIRPGVRLRSAFHNVNCQ